MVYANMSCGKCSPTTLFSFSASNINQQSKTDWKAANATLLAKSFPLVNFDQLMYIIKLSVSAITASG